MAVKMRLRREGKRKQPFYRVVVADSRSPRDGRYLEDIGYYQPLHDPSTISIDRDRALHWLRNGVQPSDAVRQLLRIEGIWEEFKPGDRGRDRSGQHARKAAEEEAKRKAIAEREAEDARKVAARQAEEAAADEGDASADSAGAAADEGDPSAGSGGAVAAASPAGGDQQPAAQPAEEPATRVQPDPQTAATADPEPSAAPATAAADADAADTDPGPSDKPATAAADADAADTDPGPSDKPATADAEPAAAADTGSGGGGSTAAGTDAADTHPADEGSKAQ